MTKQFYNTMPTQNTRHSRLLIKLMVFAGVILLSSQSLARGAVNEAEYNLKAAYLFQFTKFAQWPSDQFANEDSPIKICILGKNPFGKSLSSFSNRVSQHRKLSIQYFSSLKKITDCQLVFISRSEVKRLAKILPLIENSATLFVSDIDNFAQRGGIIGFVPRQNKIGIEINVSALRLSGAKLSSKLLELATLVSEQAQ